MNDGEEITVAVTRNTLVYETGCMSAEDQHYIARAALAGVRFWKASELGTEYWFNNITSGGMYSLPRAAVKAMAKLGHISDDEAMRYLWEKV